MSSIRNILFLAGLSVSGSINAQAPDIDSCRSIEDDSRRLACYDSAIGRPSGPVTSDGLPPSPSHSQATQLETAETAVPASLVLTDPVADFGLSESQKRAKSPEESQKRSPDQITAKVVDVKRWPAGELVVTLDVDQVWMQSETISKARISPGDTVTVKKAALGSYLMVAPNKVSMRVRRVR